MKKIVLLMMVLILCGCALRQGLLDAKKNPPAARVSSSKPTASVSATAASTAAKTIAPTGPAAVNAAAALRR